MTFFTVLMNDVLGSPPVLIGIFALAGLIIQKKSFSQIISGTIKAVLGFLLLGLGAEILISIFEVFGQIFQQAFRVQGVIPTNEAIVALAQQTLGREVALVMFFGMIWNIIFARITPFRYIFLTGHHTLFMAALIVAIFASFSISSWISVPLGSILLGLTMVLFPALIQPYVNKITKSADLAVGHFGSFGYWVAGFSGSLFSRSSQNSTENLKVPQSLYFLRDTPVAIAVTMSMIFLISVSFAGFEFVRPLSNGIHPLVFALMEGLKFSAGMYIILIGVRLLISEITIAFKGVATRFVPNAKPALDCPIVFPFAPNAVILGFLVSFFGGILMTFILPFLSLPVILPGLIPHFFTGGTAGVFGNATGGRKGALLGAFLNGILISLLPAFLLPLLGDLGYTNTTFGDSDFSLVGILLGNILKVVS